MVNQPADDLKSDGNGAIESTGDQKPAPVQLVQIDESQVTAAYANFCRVSSTPEELILDLGLNPTPFGPQSTPIRISQRIILNHYTAKRLLAALSEALKRHEQAFGVLETDVRKRVRAKQ
jgi:hypothetical protein